jgi:hypothetical protein
MSPSRESRRRGRGRARRQGGRRTAPLQPRGISPQLDADILKDYGFDLVIYPSLGIQTTIAVYKRAVQYREGSAAAFAEMAKLPFYFHEFAGSPEVVV